MAWWERVPRSIQMWITIALSLATLASISYAKGAKATAGGMEDIHVRVEALEAHNARQDAAILATDGKLDRVVCLLLLPDSLSAIAAERACP